jgi:hypothetical protein
MNRDDSPGPDPYHAGGTTRVIAANMQWHDAELALKVARPNYERWMAAGREDTPSPAIVHAYYTHEALDEAARHHSAHRYVPVRGGRVAHHRGA